METDRHVGAVECVKYPDGEGLAHSGGDLVGGPPVDGRAFFGWPGLAADDTGAEDHGDDAEADVFVDAGEPLGLNSEAGFLFDLAAHACVDGFVEFKNAAGDFPFTG